MPKLPWRYLAIVLIANLTLLLPAASPLRITGALLLVGSLPGWSWANWLLSAHSSLLRWTVAAALSFSLTMLTALWLHYLPGPVQTWQIIISLNLVTFLPFLRYIFTGYTKKQAVSSPADGLSFNIFKNSAWLPFALILLVALFLRGVNLGYSEFQGDESLALISAAESLEGHEDALFLRSKGPGEVLLPMALWRLTGITNELIARLPFILAGMGEIVTLYLIGRELKNNRVGWLAAGFFALNGFAVAFSRIVQYQILVLWLSSLAFLLVWQWRQSGQHRLVVLAGLCLGAGLLAHYDAVLVLPAIVWLFITNNNHPIKNKRQDAKSLSRQEKILSLWPLRLSVSVGYCVKSFLLFLVALLFVALPFYLPYSLDPRANRTGEYVGGRIGHELRNNLPDFFHFNTFYSSSYYIILTGLLAAGMLAWWAAGKRADRLDASWSGRLKSVFSSKPWHWGVIPLLVISIAGVVVKPDLLAIGSLNLAALPFALLFLAAFLTLSPGSLTQGVVAWLAVPFLGYNFVVALGLTHIYTTVPAWSLLAALAWTEIFNRTRTDSHRFFQWISNFLLTLFFILSTVFLWNAFVRHDVEYWQDYPNGNLLFYWNPYDTPPQAGFFGFAHRTGWKAVGQKIASGALNGDYSSNEEPDITAWYTRGAPRACDPRPEFYFLADDLIDPVETPAEVIAANYEPIGAATLPNHKQMRVMQQKPVALALGELAEAALSAEFDQTATPAAFARSARGATPIAVNFDRLVQLIGYNLDTRRAYPGGRITVTLYWQALAPIPASYQVFTHLESQNGPAAQADGVPVCWTYPTDRWQPSQIIADQHAITLPPEIAPGSYPLQIGLYLADTRLNVLDEAGNPAGTSVTLAEVEIKNKR